MPTYEYVCQNCSHRFEAFQSMTADPIKQCPQCDKKKVKRLIGSGAGLIFKGSGFYQTDYRSSGYQKEASADKPQAAAKDSSSKKDKKSASNKELKQAH